MVLIDKKTSYRFRVAVNAGARRSHSYTIEFGNPCRILPVPVIAGDLVCPESNIARWRIMRLDNNGKLIDVGPLPEAGHKAVPGEAIVEQYPDYSCGYEPSALVTATGWNTPLGQRIFAAIAAALGYTVVNPD